MFRRFASGTAVAAIAIACAVLSVLLMPAEIRERFCPLTVVWCFVPAVWGLWAMFTPAGWMPQRLPIWGAVLGLIAGVLVGFVFDLLSHIHGQTVPVTLRGVAVAIIIVFYYVLWMLVRVAYRSLGPRPSSA